jgi:ubiquinone/menaquinone biosynthesis C-methylase UbiE
MLISQAPDNNAYKRRIKHFKKDAERYLNRNPRRHRSELALVKRAFAGIPVPSSVLDIPCGAGRMTVLLAKNGYQCVGAEISNVMIDTAKEKITEAGLTCDVHKIDIEDMDYPDRNFDTVLCFRLFHHFPTPVIRKKVVNELCRVAKHNVAISYLSPLSYTSIKRNIRQKIFGQSLRQHPTSLSELKSYFSENRFSLLITLPEQLFIHSLHLAVFKRDSYLMES